MKTEGELQHKVRSWIWRTLPAFVMMYMLTTIFTLIKVPSMLKNFDRFPFMYGVVVLNVLAIGNIPRALYLGREMEAFISSSCTIAALILLFGMGVYPNLITSSLGASYSLTIYNASSSHETLRIMLWIAALGMPFVIAYTISIYWIFRGKVKLDRFSY